MEIATLIGLVLTFFSTTAALLQVVNGTHQIEAILIEIRNQLIHINTSQREIAAAIFELKEPQP